MKQAATTRRRGAAAAAVVAFAVSMAALSATPWAGEARADEVAASATALAAPPTVAASGSASAAPRKAGAAVKLRDRRVFELRAARVGLSPEERAKAASAALERALQAASEGEPPKVRVDGDGDVATVFVGATPIVQLGEADATEAADSSLAVHAASVASKVSQALEVERTRMVAAHWVFSVSLVVFSALMALLLGRKLSEMAGGARAWVNDHPEKLPTLRVQGADLVSPAALAGGLAIALSAGQLLGQVGIAYVWVLFTLSQFEQTRGYTERFTRAVLGPIAGLFTRLIGSVPLLVVGAVSLFGLLIALRVVALFFKSVERGDAKVEGISREQAEPTSLLTRAALVIVTLLLGAPLITGSSEGALPLAGAIALTAVALSSVPLLSAVLVGAVTMYGRKLRKGDEVEIAGHRGQVTGVGLLEITLRGEGGDEVRVPHLVSLTRPARSLRARGACAVEIAVQSGDGRASVREVLEASAKGVCEGAEIEMIAASAGSARFVVRCRGGCAAGSLLEALLDGAERGGMAVIEAHVVGGAP